MSLANIGSKVERIHPAARFMRKHSLVMILGWGVISFILFILLSYFLENRIVVRLLGWAWLYAFLAPVFIMYVIRRLIPLHRITDCPFCGHHEEIKMGRSPFA